MLKYYNQNSCILKVINIFTTNFFSNKMDIITTYHTHNLSTDNTTDSLSSKSDHSFLSSNVDTIEIDLQYKKFNNSEIEQNQSKC